MLAASGPFCWLTGFSPGLGHLAFKAPTLKLCDRLTTDHFIIHQTHQGATAGKQQMNLKGVRMLPELRLKSRMSLPCHAVLKWVVNAGALQGDWQDHLFNHSFSVVTQEVALKAGPQLLPLLTEIPP